MTTVHTSKASIDEVSWSAIRDKLYELKPGLTEIIDAMPSSERQALFIARYPFGTNLIESGTLMLPSNEGRVVPIHDDSVHPKIKQHLGYASIPVCVWLNTAGEVYVDIEGRRLSLNVFKPGSFCGLWEVFDSHDPLFAKRIWSVAVGCRTLFALPKLSDKANFNRIEKKYGLRSLAVPKTIYEQVNFFSHIANSQLANCEWESQILFFSKDWFDETKNKKSWLVFNHHLLKEDWERSIYWRNKVTFDLIGQIFSHTQSNQNLKPNPYLIDTAMYLLSIGIGCSPGFMPISDDEIFGPIRFIQKIITEEYGLKKYAPTLMCPNYLQAGEIDEPVYYSMQLPTMLGTAPKLRKPHSVLEDMRMVKKLLESLSVTLEKKANVIFELIRNIDFEFFHTDVDKHTGIRCSTELPLLDSRLVNTFDNNKSFCENSSFIRGCVRISRRR